LKWWNEPNTKPAEKTTEKPVEMNSNGEKKTEPTVPATKPSVAPASSPSKANGNGTTWQVNVKKISPQGSFVQLMSLNSMSNVLEETAKANKIFPGKVLVREERNETDEVTYKLLLGPYPDKKTATAARKVALKKGYADCFVP
jgi:SPOR domain